MNKALLVLTVGRTDVQLVENGRRKEFSKRCCAALHDQLEQRASDWCLVDPPANKDPEEVETLPDGRLQLCTPKLDAVLEFLNSKRVLLTHVLILETRRDPDVAKEDPRAAGFVLERRLHAQLGTQVEVTRTAYLQGTERLEGRDLRDAVIRRDVVTRIDKALRAAIAKVEGGQVIVATTGGFPQIATLVDEAVCLYAGRSTQVELIEVSDASRADPPALDRAVPRRSVPEPVESYRARRHALELIDGGNLLAAWGAVQHLHADEVEQKWTRILEWLYLFAASLPIPNECDISVLRHPLMAVRAGLRVEFALRAGDVPRAVHGTVAFFEATLWDHLLKRATRHPNNNRLFSFKDHPPENLVRRGEPYESKGAAEDERKRPFILKETSANGTDWYAIDDSDVCAIRLAKHYLHLEKLTKLGQVISQIRELRNDVAHNEPTPKLMEDAQKIMVEKGFWSSDASRWRFLKQPLVKEVLEEFEVDDPEKLCDSLIDQVTDRLRRASAEESDMHAFGRSL